MGRLSVLKALLTGRQRADEVLGAGAEAGAGGCLLQQCGQMTVACWSTWGRAHNGRVQGRLRKKMHQDPAMEGRTGCRSDLHDVKEQD